MTKMQKFDKGRTMQQMLGSCNQGVKNIKIQKPKIQPFLIFYPLNFKIILTFFNFTLVLFYCSD